MEFAGKHIEETEHREPLSAGGTEAKDYSYIWGKIVGALELKGDQAIMPGR